MKERVKTQIYIKDGKHYIRLKNTGCEEKEYEIIKSDNLYDMIHDGIPLQVYKKCVIGFSMSEYRQKYKISGDSLVEVKIDSIIDCCFVGQNQTAADFTYCNFVSTDEVVGIMLEDNIFYNGTVDFSYCQIGNLDFSMKGCHFIKSEVIVAYSEFGNKDIYFNDTIFEDVSTFHDERVIDVNVNNSKNRDNGLGRGLLIEGDKYMKVGDCGIQRVLW